jgi:hypothetical protein
MRKAVLLTLFGLVAADVAHADVVRHSFIPQAYRGTWVAGAGTTSDKSVIVLSATTYVSGGTRCSVKWVSQTAGARGSIYAAHLQCLDPAGTAGKTALSDLIIWPDGIDQIAVGAEFMSLMIFHRCPATRPPSRDRLASADSAGSGGGAYAPARIPSGARASVRVPAQTRTGIDKSSIDLAADRDPPQGRN